jgi:cytochrome oxidase assembly protein ShyY1
VYRFLASPRWLAIHGATAAAVAVFMLLGLWQLGQFQRPATTVSAEFGTAVPLGHVSTAGGSDDTRSAGRLVTVSGTYDGQRQLLVGDRRLRGRAGYLVLTPLRTEDGSAVIVDRGWVPAAGVAATAVPAGRVTVTGRLARSETDADTGVPPLTDAPAGRAYRVNSEELGALLPYPVHGGYLSLLDQQPPSAVAPAVAAVGESGGGRWYNAGYAMQWFLFAVAAVGFWGRLVTTEVRERRGPAVGAVSATADPSLPRV